MTTNNNKQMNLKEKIDHSIALIRKAEKLALAMNDQGFHVGFSGGKDSQVLLELVKMAGVKYRAVYNVTTNDPVENVRFIKEQYPDVIFDRPKQSFFQLVAKKGLPTQLHRFCCAILKERAGVGYVVLTGVRAEESFKRSQYAEVRKWGNDKDKEIDLDKMEQAHFQCVGGKDKFMVYPILQWTERDVWQFIREREAFLLTHATPPKKGSAASSAHSHPRGRSSDKSRPSQSSTKPSCTTSRNSSTTETAEDNSISSPQPRNASCGG